MPCNLSSCSLYLTYYFHLSGGENKILKRHVCQSYMVVAVHSQPCPLYLKQSEDKKHQFVHIFVMSSGFLVWVV